MYTIYQKTVTDILKIPTDSDSTSQKLCPQEIFQENLWATLRTVKNIQNCICKYLRTGIKHQLKLRTDKILAAKHDIY
jgi:hypothetical protein